MVLHERNWIAIWRVTRSEGLEVCLNIREISFLVQQPALVPTYFCVQQLLSRVNTAPQKQSAEFLTGIR
ncbi:unnamed protein product [Victoria cruziana]